MAADPQTRASRRIGRPLLRAAQFVVLLLVVNNLLLPQIAGARKAVDVLRSVNPALLLLGILLEMAALATYSMFTMATLPADGRITLGTLMRIQLATKAVTNVVPGGSAAGSALGYRLLVQAGVRGTDAGFALVTVGLGSAIMLNAILWVGLMVSIPLRGFDPRYGTAAVAGGLLIVLAAALVLGVAKGQERSERMARWLAVRIPRIDPDRFMRVIGRLGVRMRQLWADRDLLAKGVAFAAANWLLDAAALWVFLRAFGVSTPIEGLIVAFCLANVLVAIPLTPGGLGIFEAALVSLLVGFSLDRATALVGVTAYRLCAYWVPIPLGALTYLSLRIGPVSLHRLGEFRRATVEAYDQAGSRLDWTDRLTRPAASDVDGPGPTLAP